MREEEEEKEPDRETERRRDGWRVMTRRMEGETGETRASKAITHLRRRHPRVPRLPPAALGFFHLVSPPPASSHTPSAPPARLLSPFSHVPVCDRGTEERFSGPKKRDF